MPGKRGAPFGNQNSAKGKLWSDTLRKIAVQNPEKLRGAAEALYAKALDGDVGAIKELGDRFDGRPQTDANVNVTGNLAAYLAELPREVAEEDGAEES